MISFCDDESKVASFMWYHNRKHISEAEGEAVAINDAFDVSAYAASHELAKTGPPKARKRSFDPAPAGPSTPQRDPLNRLLDEGMYKSTSRTRNLAEAFPTVYVSFPHGMVANSMNLLPGACGPALVVR